MAGAVNKIAIIWLILLLIILGYIGVQYGLDMYSKHQNKDAPFWVQDNYPNGYTEGDVEEAISKYRIEHGKNGLSRYDPLCDFAKIRVYEIKQDWSHGGFEKRISGGDPALFDRFCGSKELKCLRIGENLAKNYPTVEELISGWDQSSGHKENMLGDYNVQCVAVSEDHVVSLFAYAENVDLNLIKSGYPEDAKVTYSFEMVKYWERRMVNDREVLESWDKKDIGFYAKEDITAIVGKLERMIDAAEYLWDGYTNSKITYDEANRADKSYYKLNEEVVELIKEANKNAYENCADAWEDVGKDPHCDGFLR